MVFDCLTVDCDISNLYGRLTNEITEDDFSRLSQNPLKRLAWVYSFLGMSHVNMLINCLFSFTG